MTDDEIRKLAEAIVDITADRLCGQFTATAQWAVCLAVCGVIVFSIVFVVLMIAKLTREEFTHND